MNVLVLQHIACEPPGAFEDVLLERGARIERVELDEGDPMPDSLDGVDAVIAMGGPMSVNDEHEHPWLVPEEALLREAVQSAAAVAAPYPPPAYRPATGVNGREQAPRTR